MARIFSLFIGITIFFTSLFSVTSFADGDGNMEGGGGDMGGGTQDSYWTVGNEGVRVSVIRNSDKSFVGQIVDLTNIDPSTAIHFGKTNKLQYKNGKRLIAQTSSYTFINPGKPLPRIISVGGINNIAAIKQYFCSEYTLMRIAEHTGVPFAELTNGQYKLLVEPLAYFKYNGNFMAMTATEAALYDEIESGSLRAKMGFLTHQNLPFSIFLEVSDLGFPAWSGSTGNPVSNANIKSSLGLGIVRFTELPPEPPIDPPPEIDTYDYVYHTDTDVITSVLISSNYEISPDDDAEVEFTIGDRTYTKGFVCPEDESQLVWIKWHTESTPAEIIIDVNVSDGNVDKSTIKAKIVALDEIIPPDPKGRDIAPMRFYVPNRPKSFGYNTYAQWGEWYPKWHRGDEDEDGYWTYRWDSYSVSLEAQSNLAPDEKCPTAIDLSFNNWEMKSGYGVKLDTTAKIYGSGRYSDYDVTGIQNAAAVFSEFQYKDYNRILRISDNIADNEVTFNFKPNPYSQWENPSHFTPVWYPDNKNYTVVSAVFDIWTPTGQLYITTDDSVEILGSCFDDWKVRPVIR